MQNNYFNSYNEDMSHADLPQSVSYLSGNQLVLGQQGIDGALLSLRVQTASFRKDIKNSRFLESIVYSQGIQGSYGPAAWFEVKLEDGRLISLVDPSYDHVSYYEDNILPKTILGIDGIEFEINSYAPIRKQDTKIERISGLFYTLKIKNTSEKLVVSQVSLRLNGSVYLVKGGAGEWWLSQPEVPSWDAGLAAWVYPPHQGIHLIVSGGENGHSEFQRHPILKWDAHLQAGSAQVFTSALIFDDHRSPVDHPIQTDLIEAWKTASIHYWQELTGNIDASWAKQFPAVIQRSAQEALLCVRCDREGNVVGIAPSPVPVEEYPLLCDILWIGFPALYLQPDLYQKMIDWYVDYWIANLKDTEKDTRSRVIPAIMMGLGYRITGRKDLFVDAQELTRKVECMLETINNLEVKYIGLYPTELIRLHKPLMSIELGTNILCWSASNLWSILCEQRGCGETAEQWRQAAKKTHATIQEKLVFGGPGESGYLLAGLRHGDPTNDIFPFLYYEEDALEIAIAPYLGFCSSQSGVWKDTLNYMFTPLYDVVHNLPDTMLWWEKWNQNGMERQEKFTYPSILARLNSIEDSDVELDRALIQFSQEIGTNGALWEKTTDGKRLMRSGRLCGAAYLVFLNHILGLHVDGAQKKISITPKTTWRTIDLSFGKDSSIPFEIHFRQGQERASMQFSDKTASRWCVNIGFWFPSELSVNRVEINHLSPVKEIQIRNLKDWQDVIVNSDLKKKGSLDVYIEMRCPQQVYQAFAPLDQE